MTRVANAGTTLRRFAQSLMPEWKFPNDWLEWPPDAFAFTSAVLQRTGCYRIVLTNTESVGWEWESAIRETGRAWIRYAADALSDGTPRRRRGQFRNAGLADTIQVLTKYADEVTLEQLRIIDSDLSDQDPAMHVALALLRLHASADEACAGFGVLSLVDSEAALAHGAANLLLSAKGSLSYLPKHLGVVLPKMRTPQAGLTVRSFSHHLTWHVTEAEVMWRAIPWPDVDENTVNIIAVPWPTEVETGAFRARPDTFDPVRFFSYDPPRKKLPIADIVAMIERTDQTECRVHILAFPEASLTRSEYQLLLDALRESRKARRITWVPMVIAGVRGDSTSPDGERDRNEVRLAAYFTGKWYQLAQRKHHRWKLDANQIRQYGLEGSLSTARNWYEQADIAQRRLTFLVPNGWLTLCPLICEDLAQLEPVSELIRGVGPTLLVSLLADGPQLKDRWSARYASVLADDPGTAVLTLTSLGMAARARRRETGPGKSRNRTIALWKDNITGWREIDLADGHDAVLITVSATYREEFTADGRSDRENAAVFKWEGMRQLKFAGSTNGSRGAGSISTSTIATDIDEPDDDDDLWADWTDIRELTAATFSLNAVLSLRNGSDIERVTKWVLADRNGSSHSRTASRHAQIVDQILDAQVSPRRWGVAGAGKQWPTPSLSDAIQTMRALLVHEDGNRDFARLIESAIKHLDELTPEARATSRKRIERAVPYAILTCIHSQLAQLRRVRPPLPPAGSTQNRTKAETYEALFCRIEQTLISHGA